MHRKTPTLFAFAFAAGLTLTAQAREPSSKSSEKASNWASEMPLQLSVRNSDDLAFKSFAERQYLFFNLLAAGKVAYDKDDFATAATKWESLLRVPNLPAELDAFIRPWAQRARERAGGAASSSEPLPAPKAAETVPAADVSAETHKRTTVTVNGVISGGGNVGPGGAVIFLKRADGSTPRPKAGRARAVVQKDKRFVPHVLAVPVGSTVEFRNEDPLFHNVFSLSKPNDFDLGLYKSGTSKEQLFETPGPVSLLCNIHASMSGYVYVVDTPWFAQADAAGKFAIKSVPPGEYTVEVWHEAASKNAKKTVTVSDAMESVAVAISADKSAPAFVPDKAGKPRQTQLGY